MCDLLLVFIKWPEPGQVKTRLAQVLGDQEAAEIYRELVRRVMANLCGLRAEERLWIVYDPPERGTEVQAWLVEELAASGIDLAQVEFHPQAAGNLGVRLRVAFENGFAAGYRRIAAIGSDCVELGIGDVRTAWEALDERKVVFGPATDGGYYLVALDKREALAVFNDIPWSSEDTLQVSLQRAREAQFEVTLLEQKSDVDTAEDWRRVC